MNVASNTIITDDSALGYINACEDIDLTPLKSFWMKRKEFITVDSTGQFRIKDLSYPCTEIIGVFYQFQDLYQQNEYLQFVDPITFGKGYGTVYTDAIYTQTTASDGTNDQVIQTYPAPPSALIGIEYYYDWERLGDLTTGSQLQTYTLSISGTSSINSTLTFSSTINGQTVSTPIVIPPGTTAQSLQTLLTVGTGGAQPPLVKFQNLPGNNVSYWAPSAIASTTNVLLTSPQYISDVATLGVSGVPAGLTLTLTPTAQPLLQTVQTNWWLYNYPYMYYYGALKHAYNGLDDPERYQFVEKEWLKSVQVFQQFTDRAEFAGSNRQFDYNQTVIW